MRIVLLGATGFVGHHLLARLSASGHDCLALSRHRMSCRDLSIIPRVEVRQGDVLSVYAKQLFFITMPCLSLNVNDAVPHRPPSSWQTSGIRMRSVTLVASLAKVAIVLARIPAQISES